MSKMSRRKQSKPQHVSNDSDGEEKKLEIDLNSEHTEALPQSEAFEEELSSQGPPALSPSAESPVGQDARGAELSQPSSLEPSGNQLLRRTNRRRSATKRSLESNAGLGSSESDADESDVEEGGLPSAKKSDSPPVPRAQSGRSMTSGHPHPRLIRRTCQFCGEVKPTPAALQRHLRKHTGERPFICTGCNKAYKAKRSLQLHQLTYHPELIDNKKGGLGSRGAPNMIRSAIARRLERQQHARHHPEPGEVVPSSFSSPPLSSPPVNSSPAFNMAPPSSCAPTASSPVEKFGSAASLEDYYAQANQVLCHMPDFRSPSGPGPGPLPPSSSFEQVAPPAARGLAESPRAVLPSGGLSPGLAGPSYLYNGFGEGGEELPDAEISLDSRTCKICQKVCAKPSDVKRHMLVHSGLKPFPCVRCGKGFKAKGSMMYHMKAAHNIDVELSQGLEKRYLEQKNRAFKRSLFAKETPASKSLEESLQEGDSMSDDAAYQYSEEKQGNMMERGMVGGTIGRVITEDGPYKRSNISIRNETVLVTRLDGVRMDTEEEVCLYKCYICGQFFNKPSRIQSHLSVHFQLESASFQCSVCEENFGEQKDLVCHLERKHNISSNGDEGAGQASLMDGAEQDSPDEMVHAPQRSEESRNGNGMAVRPGGNSAPSIYTGRIRPYWRRAGGRYSCRICHKTFHSQGVLSRHELSHKGQGLMFHRLSRMRQNLEMVSRYKDRRGGLRSRFRSLPRISLQEHNKEEEAVDASLTRPEEPLQGEEKMEGEEMAVPSTSQSGEPSAAMEKQQFIEEAKEILEKEGIEEEVTVVVPSDPPFVNSDTPSDTQKSPGSEMASDSQDTDETHKSDTWKAPSRSILSSYRKEIKSRRKSSQPVKLGFKPEDNTRSSPSFPVNNCEASSSRHSSPPEKNSPAELEDMLPSRSSREPAIDPDTVSSLMGAAYSHAAALGGLHPYFLAAASQAAAVSQAAANHAASTQGLLHNGLMHGLPPTTLALSPLLHHSLSVQVPGESGRSMKSPSPSLSPSSQTSPSDPDSLVGYPRVQWNQVTGEPMPMSNKDFPAWHPYANLPEAMRVSVDGRKVTSLSRTHSRLHVVKQPVDREKACKPSTLPDGRTVYRCNVCNKEFLSYSDINRHMDFHEDIRPYKCKFCEYYARTNSQLKVHMMRHQGIREYCCRLCNYKGVTQSDLNRHMKSQIHLLKSSHQCPDCGEGFVSIASLESHKCKIRGMTWFKSETASPS